MPSCTCEAAPGMQHSADCPKSKSDRKPCGCLFSVECHHKNPGFSGPEVKFDASQFLQDNPVKDTNPKVAIGDTKAPLECTSAITRAYTAIALYLGKVKYGAWNWRAKGARATTYYAAACRHLDQWYQGEFYDADGTPHLANAIACITILIEANHLGKLEDDRPPFIDLKPIYAEIEEMMKIIKAKYGDRLPYHYTIKDQLK